MRTFLVMLLSLTFFVGASAQADAIDKFFKTYQDNEDFTMVYVSPKMFQMVSKAVSEIEDPEVKDLVKDIRGLKILTTDKNASKYYNEAITKINTKEYEVLMTVRDKETNVKFLTKESSSNVIEELLLLVGEPDEFVLMSFVGKLDLQKVAKLAKKLDMEGAEHLGKLEKK